MSVSVSVSKGQPEKTHLFVDAASALFYSVDASLSD